MKRSEVNKDPAKALARATTDMRCAAKKLAAFFRENSFGPQAAALLEMVDEAERVRDFILNGGLESERAAR